MKKATIITLALSALLPIAAFSQPQPAPPAPPAPPNPPTPPAPIPPRDRDRQPKVPVTFLGVETSEVPTVLCDQLGLPKGFGLVVDYVVPDGPAATAGVQQNDVIKMLNDQILTDPGQLSKLVRSYQDGTTVTLTLMRKGQEQKVSVKLSKKEVPRRNALMDHTGHGFHFNFGDMGDLKEQMNDLKEQLGDESSGMIHDAVMNAQAEAERVKEEVERQRDQQREQMRRVRDEVQRARDEAKRAMGVISVTRNNGNGLTTTKIDVDNAQIVLSDDKGELRIENKDGKKLLTAKDPQGKLLFSGPVNSKEELDKVPAEVRQRYEKLQQNDLPSVDLHADRDNDSDVDDDDSEDDDDNEQVSTISYEQVSAVPLAGSELLPLI